MHNVVVHHLMPCYSNGITVIRTSNLLTLTMPLDVADNKTLNDTHQTRTHKPYAVTMPLDVADTSDAGNMETANSMMLHAL